MERNKKFQISQDAFDALVQENINDFEMDPRDAVEDAINTLKLQGADLTGIVTSIAGEENVSQHPVIKTLNEIRVQATGLDALKLQDLESITQSIHHVLNEDIDNMNVGLQESMDTFYKVLLTEGKDNIFIAVKNGGVEIVTSICATFRTGNERTLASALKVLALLLPDVQSTEKFRQQNGSKILMEILEKNSNKTNIVDVACTVVAAAVTGNEVLKEEFMELKIDELLRRLLKEKENRSFQSIYDTICMLVKADDNRVVASQAYMHARKFAEAGMTEVLLDVAQEDSPSNDVLQVSCITLRSIAVNEEICKSIAEKGGIDMVLQCLETCGIQRNKNLAKSSCSLLTQLAGSDANKDTIVLKEGIEKLISLASFFMEEPSVIQEIMGCIRTLALRSPTNAAKAVKVGIVDVTVEAMQLHASASLMQKHACLMIRNLVARNPENRPIFLEKGVECLIRGAKKNHDNCKEAATAALRDLGLADYNT